MSDTYGAGLNFATIGPGAAAPVTPGAPLDISPQIDNSGALPAGGVQTQPAPAPAPTPPAQPTFGSSLNLLGPNYNAPNPAETALDQSADLLQQRIARAGQIATNPLAQFFAPEQVQAARDFVPKAAQQLQQIATQKAQIQAGRTQAQQLGLTPDEAPDQATQDDRIQVASVKALNGDLRAFQGIQAIAPDRAAAIAPQVYAKIGAHLDNAQTAFDSLSGMENEGQYQAKIQQLRTDGTITDLEGAGLQLPPTLDAFKAAAPNEALALRNARVAINTYGQALEQRNTYTPMATDEQDTYTYGALKTDVRRRTEFGAVVAQRRHGHARPACQRHRDGGPVRHYGRRLPPTSASKSVRIFRLRCRRPILRNCAVLIARISLAITDDKGQSAPGESDQHQSERVASRVGKPCDVVARRARQRDGGLAEYRSHQTRRRTIHV